MEQPRTRPALHDLLIDLKKLVNKHATDIEARIGQALVREKAGTNKRDGWSASTTGGEGGGGKSRSSSTESAAIGKKSADHHRDLVFAAIKDITTISDSFSKLLGRLDSIDDLAKTDVDVKLCEACGPHRKPEHRVDHRGTVGDRLTHVVDLCTDCYQFVVQSADPGSRKGRLPNETQVRDHEMRGRWKVRV